MPSSNAIFDIRFSDYLELPEICFRIFAGYFIDDKFFKEKVHPANLLKVIKLLKIIYKFFYVSES
jgi:hypothetical protein